MHQGWIRDWTASESTYWAAFNASKAEGGDYRANKQAARRAVRDFRQDFKADLMANATGPTKLRALEWGTPVEFPDFSFFDAERTEVNVQTDAGLINGWVKCSAVAAHAFVKRDEEPEALIADPKRLVVPQRKGPGSAHDRVANLLWGDMLQVIERDGNWLRVSARGRLGWVHGNDVSMAGVDDPLLEVYFIDVGQGDGVLVRTPDGRHMLVDGGLPRSFQQTGKNAADFVDWKFFVEYGDLDIRIDAMVASHCDKDHYGGLDDLVSKSKRARAERDTRNVHVDALYHAGLSYWELDEQEKNAFPDAPGGAKWLGPHAAWMGGGRDDAGSFVGDPDKPARILTRLLGDENEVADVIKDSHHPNLHGDWQKFFERSMKVGASTIRALSVPFGDVSTPTHVPGWGPGTTVAARVLSPAILDGPALPDFESTSQNTNGHSIMLRLDYRGCRVLLTGDLNKNSMHYILRAYAGHEDELACDVAKGCHHGSHDISYRFLEKVKAGATVISSGDSEGYGHPRPEIVGASAATGHLAIDAARDKLVTPLIYSTEVERGVSLGAAKLLNFSRYPVEGGEIDGTLFPKRYTGSDQALKDLQSATDDRATTGEFDYTYFKGVWTRKTGTKSIKGLRLLDRVSYGLVNVRTDGELVMCATQTDSGGGWVVHAFPARFG